MNSKILVVNEKYDVEEYGILGFNEHYELAVLEEIGDVEFEIINVDDSGESAIVEYRTFEEDEYEDNDMTFKEFLDDHEDVEYRYFGEHNVLSIKYDDDNWEVSKAIKELCEEFGFINGVRVTGRAVLEVSSNPKVIEEFGFESVPYEFF